VEERMKESDKMKALSLLLAIGNSGRHYKELICEHSGVKVVVDCLVQSKNEAFQEESRILLLNLGRGNPRFQVHVAEMVLSLLGTNNTGAQRTGAQCTRTFMQTLPPGFDYVASAIPMLKSADLQVQYEAMELLKNLLKYTYLHEASTVCKSRHRLPVPSLFSLSVCLSGLWRSLLSRLASCVVRTAPG